MDVFKLLTKENVELFKLHGAQAMSALVEVTVNESSYKRLDALAEEFFDDGEALALFLVWAAGRGELFTHA